MKSSTFKLILFLFAQFYFVLSAFSQKQHTIRVHFLYGSRPTKEAKATQRKDFGGVLGGHVGVEVDSNHILNFLPAGGVHVFAKDKNRNSLFTVHTFKQFYQILGTPNEDVKKLIITIPITEEQKLYFDSLSQAYMEKTPYDYAFFGMRCGAAGYDVLSKMGLVKEFRKKQLIRKVFYPRKLRKRLLKLAAKNNWKIERSTGTSERKWEGDFRDEDGVHTKKR
jgi:hypothetical protein